MSDKEIINQLMAEQGRADKERQRIYDRLYALARAAGKVADVAENPPVSGYCADCRADIVSDMAHDADCSVGELRALLAKESE